MAQVYAKGSIFAINNPEAAVRMLYEVPVRHHVLAFERKRPPADVLNGHETIWRVVDGKFVQDPQLFAELRANASQP